MDCVATFYPLSLCSLFPSSHLGIIFFLHVSSSFILPLPVLLLHPASFVLSPSLFRPLFFCSLTPLHLFPPLLPLLHSPFFPLSLFLHPILPLPFPYLPTPPYIYLTLPLIPITAAWTCSHLYYSLLSHLPSYLLS